MQTSELAGRRDSGDPLDTDARVDEAAYSASVRGLVEGGVIVITAHGNTGEFQPRVPGEVRRNLEVAVEAVSDALIMAGLGFDVATAVESAPFAERAGAGLVMVYQPVHPFQTPKGWLAYHRAIAGAVPALGVVLYLRDPTLGADLRQRLVDACSDVIAIKYSVPDPAPFGDIVATVDTGRVTWVCGLAETCVAFLWVAGARGFTSGLVNVAPRLTLAMFDHLRSGDYEQAMKMWWAGEAVQGSKRPHPVQAECVDRQGGACAVGVVLGGRAFADRHSVWRRPRHSADAAGWRGHHARAGGRAMSGVSQ